MGGDSPGAPLDRLTALAQEAPAREDGSRGMLPEELRRAYGIDALHARGLRGQGQVVAIISFDTFLDSDLQAWDQRTGTVDGGPVEKVEVEGPMTLGGGALEVNLDIQTVRAIAPEATIIDFESDWSSSSYAAPVEAVLADGRADIASMSWGHCEAHGDAWPEQKAWFQGLIEAEKPLYEEAAAAGLTIFSSSGDEGVYGCVRTTTEEFHDVVATLYPASHPKVVSVGGTYEWRRPDGTYYREATWTGPMSGSASGGGASRIFSMPDWQVEYGLGDRSPMRLTPDVAGPADPDSGLLVMYTPMQLVDGAWTQVATCPDGVTAPPCETFGGGTSQAAPYWAAVAALIRQGAEEQGLLPIVDGRPRMPFLTPLLYRIAAMTPDAFRDITAGSNLLDAAGPSWDAATGLGTPNLPALAEAVWDQLRASPPG
jgi:kumamolisin